ncbi:hypothetical protein K438DRAFT_1977360 [Mycena galopus ATCC 62051]|nr:hypothetical protein K438DRAFT_1977360 [Mycena galopus ATCC 62051]
MSDTQETSLTAETFPQPHLSLSPIDSAAKGSGESDTEVTSAEATNPIESLRAVLTACGLSPFSPEATTVLREGREMGRQAVFNVDEKWIVRIFELHDGYRQPATFLWRVLKELEHVNAPSERIHHYGILPNTTLHYTVTVFADGIPLTDELCTHPEVRAKIVALYQALRKISVPDNVGTVQAYMKPRLERLQARVSCFPADLTKAVGELSPLSDFRAFRMVVSHCDMVPENILGRFEPLGVDFKSVSISVIDWEFAAYVPEFRVGVQMGSKDGREVWGKDFLHRIGYGPYSDPIVWTESLCMLAEDHEGSDAAEFEEQVKVALEAR